MSARRKTDSDAAADRLTRDSISEIVRALSQPCGSSTPRWNVVDALELLVDSGNFIAARTLAERIIPLVNGDGRERLFLGYVALCDLMTAGSQTEAIATLESLYVEINHNGHSLADKVRIALLLSRSLSVCVGMGTLGEAALLRARNILHVELSRAAEGRNHEFQCIVTTELAKSYLHAPTSDARAALGILGDAFLQQSLDFVAHDIRFDVLRIRFQILRALGGPYRDEYSEEALRRDARAIGGVGRALAELAIARRSAEPCEDSLLKAAELFEANSYISGAFEARFTLGSAALDRGHNSVAERHLRQAAKLADSVGFLHGSLLARVGLFQAAVIGGEEGEATRRVEDLSSLMSSEVAVGSMGLNVAAARQIVGNIESALEMARRCESLFDRRGLDFAEAQALHTIGSCQARTGNWEGALAAWERSVLLDERRFAFTSACERRALVVQALVMRDMSSVGHVQDATRSRCSDLIESSCRILRKFGDSNEARRIEARLRTANAQLCIMTKDSVAALRHTNIARSLFDALGMEYDAALIDALSGLAMIEVGKSGATEMLEEAVLTLQRPLQFFSGTDQGHIRWKVLYYLTVAGVVISQRKSTAIDRAKWKELSTSWLKDALREVAALEHSSRGFQGDSQETEFSPGLKPAALEGLKATLGVGTHKVRRGQRDAVIEAGPGDGFVH